MGGIDPVELTRELIRCPSVTPDATAALDVVQARLASMGFACHRLPFGVVDNLYAKLGDGAPHLALAGHVDVVPPGDLSRWSVDPFAATVEDGMVWGRGAVDMKSGVAAFVAAVASWLERPTRWRGSISFLVTGDEEGPGVDGTARILEWAALRGEMFDGCLVGEPTSVGVLGDMVKIGRRGSAHCRLEVLGVEGHTAYPQRADNAAHRLVRMLQALIDTPLDDGSEHFEPSTLQVTSIAVDAPAANVIPGRAIARFNIRYNDRRDAAALETWVRERCATAGEGFELQLDSSGDAFVTAPGRLSLILEQSIEAATGRRPQLGTSGGTSDARFIRHYCPVIECGLVGDTMHQADERVPIADIRALTRTYEAFLDRWFAAD